MQFGVRELTPAAVARVLGMMARSHQGLNENVSLQVSLQFFILIFHTVDMMWLKYCQHYVMP